jgi:predicted GNAT family N-acyltransferase
MQVIDVTSFEQLEVAYHIRYLVFVQEQNCPVADEFDAYDTVASHILVYKDDQPIATARWRNVDGIAKFERICVLQSQRKNGVGKVLVEALEERARKRGLQKAMLHGQTQAEGFYHKLGYITGSGPFMEDGIPHVRMEKVL